jgi:hypothetical protein
MIFTAGANGAAGSLAMHQTGGWSLNLVTGEWADLPFTQYLPTDPDIKITPSTALINCPGGCPSGSTKTINLKSYTHVQLKWTGTAGAKTVGFKYLYDCGKNIWSDLPVSVDGVFVGNALLESTRTTTLYQEAPVAATLKTGSLIEVFMNATAGCTMDLSAIKVYDA